MFFGIKWITVIKRLSNVKQSRIERHLIIRSQKFSKYFANVSFFVKRESIMKTYFHIIIIIIIISFN